MKMKSKVLSECFFCHDAIEILSWDFPSIGGCTLEHFFEFTTIHGLSKFLGYSSDIGDVDKASSIVVKQIKDFINSVLKIKLKLLWFICRQVWM